MKIEVIKLYDNREDVTLTTYLVNDSSELLKGGKRPAVIICPGGAYLGCSDREAEPVALRFAAMGYHTFVLKYSVYNEGKDDFSLIQDAIEPKESCQHPMPMREIGQSILIIREHAKDWKVDVDRIAICGFSAGAHNCAMYGTNWHSPVIFDYFKEDKEKFRPAAVILGYTLSDYVYMNKCVTNDKMAQGMFSTSNTAFLGTPVVSEERLREVSPARNVTENTPPMYIWSTQADTLVPVQHSLRMAHALADHNIPFELHIFEEGPHGLSLATQASAGAKSQIYPDVAKWVGLAETWLEKRFALNLPEVTDYEEAIKRR